MLNKKICIVTPQIPPDYTGGGNRALNQAKYIAKIGYSTFLLTTTTTSEYEPNLEIITIQSPSLYRKDSTIGVIFKHFYLPFLYAKFSKIFTEKRFDLIHCISGSSYFSLTAIFAAKTKKIKIIAGTTLAEQDDPVAIGQRSWGRLKLWVFNLSDAVVNISPLLVSKCHEAGIPREKINYIPNGVDVNKFKPSTKIEKKDLRKKLKIEQFQWVFIYVGILSYRKNVKAVLEAFKLVNDEVNNCCLILAGPTKKNTENYSYYCDLNKYVKSEQLNDKVFFTGEVNNVEEWMKASDVFLFASKKEGFGTVVIEAMSCGLPAVVMNIPNITNYIISNLEDGFIVDNLNEFGERIIELINNKSTYNKISKNARTAVLNKFSIDRIMEQYISLYNKL